MGRFSRWLLRRGSVGSIARWASKNFDRAKLLYPDASDNELCRCIWNMRYEVVPAKKSEKFRFDLVMNRDGLMDELELADVCEWIIYVEMNVTAGQLFDDSMRVIEEELVRLRPDYSP